MPNEKSAETSMALGKYVLAFSYLLLALETSTIRLIAPGPSGPLVPSQIVTQRMLLEAALSERTASPIVSAFFSVLHERGKEEFKDEDKTILKHLRRELDAVVKERNRLMHDAWFWKQSGDCLDSETLLRHRLRAHGTGVEVEEEAYSPEKMNELAENVQRLAGLVMAMIWGYRSERNLRISERFTLVDRKIRQLAVVVPT